MSRIFRTAIALWLAAALPACYPPEKAPDRPGQLAFINNFPAGGGTIADAVQDAILRCLEQEPALPILGITRIDGTREFILGRVPRSRHVYTPSGTVTRASTLFVFSDAESGEVLYVLALDRGPAGSSHVGISEEGVPGNPVGPVIRNMVAEFQARRPPCAA